MLLPGDYDGLMDVICEEKVACVEISGGSPRKYMTQLREAGVVVIHKSATLKHALKAQADGVDFIEIAGFESSIAGRSSEDDVTTWVLLAKACEKLTTPVIVSGASAVGRQLAAALSMGAVGMTMGSTLEFRILADALLTRAANLPVLRSPHSVQLASSLRTYVLLLRHTWLYRPYSTPKP